MRCRPPRWAGPKALLTAPQHQSGVLVVIDNQEQSLSAADAGTHFVMGTELFTTTQRMDCTPMSAALLVEPQTTVPDFAAVLYGSVTPNHHAQDAVGCRIWEHQSKVRSI